MSKKIVEHKIFSKDIRSSLHRSAHFLFGRILYVLLFVTIQAAAVILPIIYAWNRIPYFYLIGIIITFVSAVHILNRDTNPAFKIAWMLPISIFPIFGGLLYFMFGARRIGRRLRDMSNDLRAYFKEPSPIKPAREALEKENNADAIVESNYLCEIGGAPVYQNTDVVFYESGEALFEDMLSMLRSARRYIFLEYFIIEEGVFWNSILDILIEKVKEGVEVRVLFDDCGCMLTLPMGYDATLRKYGIQARVFNPFNTVLSPRPNNRDHRKICAVDGIAAIAGGINLADEYLNRRTRFGYWKDTAIILRGDAAWSMTVQFLCVWDRIEGIKENYAAFLPTATDRANHMPKKDAGEPHAEVMGKTPLFVQPYTDIPLDGENVGESVYFQMITRAKKYVYITTPYLILTHEMITALTTAAKSGIDVRIITPHIPDKKTVFFLTRSYYKPLVEHGVKIYEYTPGFMHSKTVVTDDLFSVVGSINFDYRSLYLHMENAVWMYGEDMAKKVRDDFLALQKVSTPATGEEVGRLSLIGKVWRSILRALSPLF